MSAEVLADTVSSSRVGDTDKPNITSLTSRPRILFINRSYWPDAEATGQLLTDLCESLATENEISVLCGQPNSNPTSALFKMVGAETRAGVTIHRLKHTQFNKRKPLGRMANLASFTLATKRWLRSAGDYDAIISETDPFLLPLVVAPHCQKRKTPYIAYLQDIYPDIAIRLGKTKDNIITKGLRQRLCKAYQYASRVIVLSDAMKEELSGWGLPKEKLSIVPNWVDCESVVPIKTDNPFRMAQGWTGKFVVMHSGNMGMSQQLCALVDAVDEPAFPANAVVALVGGGADEQRLRLRAASLKNRNAVQFLPYQPRESLAQSLSSADIQVVSVDPRIGGTLMPSKLYGILASGTAVLAIAEPSSDVARIVHRERVGEVVPMHEPKLIASAIASLMSQGLDSREEMGQRARRLALSQYDRHICVQQFASVLTAALDPHPLVSN